MLFDKWISELLQSLLRWFVDVEWERLSLTWWSGATGLVARSCSPTHGPRQNEQILTCGVCAPRGSRCAVARMPPLGFTCRSALEKAPSNGNLPLPAEQQIANTLL